MGSIHGLSSLGTIFGKQIMLATRQDLKFGAFNLSRYNYLNGVLVDAILSTIMGQPRKTAWPQETAMAAELLKKRPM
jgi:hypothetical protein